MSLLQKMFGSDLPVVGANENWGGRLRRPIRMPQFADGSPDESTPMPGGEMGMPPAVPPESLTEGASPTRVDPMLGVSHKRLDSLRDHLDNPPPMSLKQKVMRGIAMAAPVALGAAFGGGEGALAGMSGEGPAFQKARENKRLDRQDTERQYENEANRVSREEQQNRQTAITGPLRRAQTEATVALGRQRNAKTDLAPSEKTQTTYDAQGNPTIKQWNPDTQRYDIEVGRGKPVADPTGGKSEFERDFYRENGAWPTLQNKIDYEHKKSPVGAWQATTDSKGNPIMFNSKTGQTRAATGSDPKAKGSEPTADEKRRDDLARNVEENLNAYEEILQRRPELFGSLAGRGTKLRQFVGSNDPDVTRLKSIKEFMGMAAVGAHAMRNANHIEKAANSVLDEVNGPDAIRGNIKVARDSLHTFHEDVKGGTRGTSPPAPGKEIHYKVVNGQLVPETQ